LAKSDGKKRVIRILVLTKERDKPSRGGPNGREQIAQKREWKGRENGRGSGKKQKAFPRSKDCCGGGRGSRAGRQIYLLSQLGKKKTPTQQKKKKKQKKKKPQPKQKKKKTPPPNKNLEREKTGTANDW